MGIFVFKCPACGTEIEEIMSFSESEKPLPCACQPDVYMKKQISTNVSAKYACGGFYTTDYKEYGKGQPASKIRKRREEYNEKWGKR